MELTLKFCAVRSQGGGLRCLCRFFCCTVFIGLFLIIGVVLCLALVRQFDARSLLRANLILFTVDTTSEHRRRE